MQNEIQPTRNQIKPKKNVTNTQISSLGRKKLWWPYKYVFMLLAFLVGSHYTKSQNGGHGSTIRDRKIELDFLTDLELEFLSLSTNFDIFILSLCFDLNFSRTVVNNFDCKSHDFSQLLRISRLLAGLYNGHKT